MDCMTEPPWIIAALCVVAVLTMLGLSIHLHSRVFTLELRVTKLWKNFSHLAQHHEEITADLEQLEPSKQKRKK